MSNLIVDQAHAVVRRTERAWLHGPTAQFVRHFIEMVIAMMVGMTVLGLLVRAVLAPLGYPDGVRPYPEVSAVAMTLEMTLPMAAWMFYRGHRPAIIAEMSGAMIAPVIAVVGLCLVHVLPSSSAPPLAHLTMYPAMLGAMLYRRTEYTREHGSKGHAVAAADHSDHAGPPNRHGAAGGIVAHVAAPRPEGRRDVDER